MRVWYAPSNHHRAAPAAGRRLFGFVLASMVLHLIVLLSQQPSPAVARRHDVTMQVTLGALITTATPATEEHHTAPPPKPTTERAPVVRQQKSVMPAHRDRQQATIAAPLPPPQAAVATPPAEAGSTIPSEIGSATTSAQSSEQQRNSLMQILRQALAQQFRYPLLARKRGWQGEVLLAFTLDSRGTIIDARIAHSSGYGALDNAAIASLIRVATIEAGPSRPLSFELPVIYRLHGG